MQNIIVEKPYQYIPPHRGTWWPAFIRNLKLEAYWLRRKHGIVEYDCRGIEHLRESLSAGHGIMLTPNHSRPVDPLVIGTICREASCLIYAMASWHLFNQSRFEAWAIHKMGGFSVNREGVDRQSLNTAIEILETGERPLVIFPEGGTTRTNDRLQALLDGVAFIARTAAKRRKKKKPQSKVVVHPIAMKHLLLDDLKETVDPLLTTIEERLTWRPQRDLPLIERIVKVGRSLLTLKEIEYFGQPQTGTIDQRRSRLIDRLLSPLEREWLDVQQSDQGIIPRVKALRMKMVPELVQGDLDEKEYQRRWSQLAGIYLAQQVYCYPTDYIKERPSVDRLYETVERYEEDITDKVTSLARHKIVIEIGPPIEVETTRDRKAETDPLMVKIQQRMQGMLDRLALESPLYEEPNVS